MFRRVILGERLKKSLRYDIKWLMTNREGLSMSAMDRGTLTVRAENALRSIHRYEKYYSWLMVPAKGHEPYVFFEDEASPITDTLTVTTLCVPDAALLVIAEVDEDEEDNYIKMPSTVEGIVTIPVHKDRWYKIGISVENWQDTQQEVGIAIHDAYVKPCIEEYMTPEESLAFLSRPNNRNTISRQLIRTMQAVGVDAEESEMSNLLSDLLVKLNNYDSPELKKSTKRTVKGWFEKNARMDREMAFQCCFALNLDIALSEELLRKGCFMNGFNMRDAKEAIYFFCLLNHLPYSHALELYQKFDAAPTVEKAGPEIGTMTIVESIKGFDWSSEDNFLQSFLIPNKSAFTSHSQNAKATYENEVGNLCYNIIDAHLRMIQDSDVVLDDVTTRRFTYWKKDRVLDRVLNYIEIKGEKNDTYREIAELVHKEEYIDGKEAAEPVIRFVEDHRYDFQRDWKKVFTPVSIFSECVYGIPEIWSANKKIDREGDFVPYKDFAGYKQSELFTYGQANDVLSSVPVSRKITKLDNELSQATRKTIILMSFFNYCYRVLRLNNNEATYDDFYDSLTEKLERCHLAYLYAGDPFDWLILKSVSLLELTSDVYDYEEDANPLEYFNEVLEMSFPDFPTYYDLFPEESQSN